jgi:hypothetical protein
MNLPELDSVEYIKIPKILYCSDTKKPFDKCLVCNQFLLADGTPYFIEKAIKQYSDLKLKEVIFEYALCVNCMVMMNQSLSEESRARISAYFEKNGNLAARRKQLVEKKSTRIAPWINRCVIKNTPIGKASEYQIVAQCDGKHLLFTYMPFALSMEAMDEMTSLLSAKSLGEMDDFIGKYFSGPPEVAALLKKRFILI